MSLWRKQVWEEKFKMGGCSRMKQGDLLSEKQWEKILNELWGRGGGNWPTCECLYFWPWPQAKSWSSLCTLLSLKLKRRQVKPGSTCAEGQDVYWRFHHCWIKTGPMIFCPFSSECLTQCCYLLLSKACVFIKIQESRDGSVDRTFVSPQIHVKYSHSIWWPLEVGQSRCSAQL